MGTTRIPTVIGMENNGAPVAVVGAMEVIPVDRKPIDRRGGRSPKLGPC